MYEPERNRFDWDNPEMRILYRILDWCQRRACDVFLTQMWSNVGWNAFPEFRDSATGRIHSGPASLDDFAEGLATMLEHLVKTKKYTCIRWLCITNEPSYAFSWFQRPPNQPMSDYPGAGGRSQGSTNGAWAMYGSPAPMWAQPLSIRPKWTSNSLSAPTTCTTTTTISTGRKGSKASSPGMSK